VVTALSLLATLIGLTVGAVSVPWSTVLTVGWGDDSLSAAIVREARLPRVLAGLLVGAGLGTAGAIMQALTRNALAGPGLMGINGGAAAALVLMLIAWPDLSLAALTAVAGIGAGLGALLVWSAAAAVPLGTTPHRLALIGAVVSAALGAGTAAVAVGSGMQNDLLYWLVGGLGTIGWSEVWQLAPSCGLGLLLAWGLAPSLAVAALGGDTATGLGLRVGRTRISATLAVLLLAGGANAAAGPVGFVGLVAPHLARALLGGDDRRVIPAASALGATLVVLADAVGRSVRPPDELPLGIFTALLGGPFLVYLARRDATWRHT
jgi:iron complex transport system permease protein